jgi:uncharacterized protein YjbI with pentapeptide repeats
MIRTWKYYALTSLFCFVTNSASAAINHYSPDQLAQFHATNQCFSCDLSGATLSGNHSNAALISTNLTGSKGSGTFSAANFGSSNLSSANWSNVNLSYAQLSYIPLIKTNFSGADLSYANFEGSNTNYAIFDGANLYGSNITQQQLDDAASYCWATLPNGIKKNC